MSPRDHERRADALQRRYPDLRHAGVALSHLDRAAESLRGAVAEMQLAGAKPEHFDARASLTLEWIGALQADVQTFGRQLIAETSRETTGGAA